MAGVLQPSVTHWAAATCVLVVGTTAGMWSAWNEHKRRQRVWQQRREAHAAAVAARKQRRKRAHTHTPPPQPPPIQTLHWEWPEQSSAPQLSLAKRPSLEDARRCLRGRHLLMAGDSHTRYQYMELISWLENRSTAGAFRPRIGAQHNGNSVQYIEAWTHLKQSRPKRFAVPKPKVALPMDGRSLSAPAEWADWNDYNVNATRAFGGRMCCDCARPSWKQSLMPCVWGYPFTRDNRYYSHNDVHVSFMFLFGDCGAVGATSPGHAEMGGARAQAACGGALGGGGGLRNVSRQLWPPPPLGRQNERVRGLLPECVEALAAANRPVRLVAYSPYGAWGPLHATDDREQMRAADVKSEYGLDAAIVQTQPLQCIVDPVARGWASSAANKSTSVLSSRGWKVVNVLGAADGLRKLANLSDAPPQPNCSRVSRHKSLCSAPLQQCADWYVDALHFQPFVYHELNMLLLHELGC